MKWKSMLAVILTNIFFMLFSSIILEFHYLPARFESLENTIATAVDTSLDLATLSDDFYGDILITGGVTGKITSHAIDKDGVALRPTILCMSGAGSNAEINFRKQDLYKFAYQMNKNNKAYTYTGILYDAEANKLSSPFAIYSWLFGKVTVADSNVTNMGQSYQHGYMTSGCNDAILDPIPSLPDINPYYDRYTSALCEWNRIFDIGWTNTDPEKRGYYFYCTDLMGVKPRGQYKNEKTSGVLKYQGHDRWYMLTPRSLGLTYISPEIFKVATVQNIANIVTLNKLSGSGMQNTRNNSWGSEYPYFFPFNCLPTNVYGTVKGRHTNNSCIVNDGLVEYDLDSCQVRILYLPFELNSSIWSINHTFLKAFGTISGSGSTNYTSPKNMPNAFNMQASLINSTQKAFANKASGYNYDDIKKLNNSITESEYKKWNSRIVIARVQCKLKVHMPYQSAVLQWARFMFGDNKGHYGIRQYNAYNLEASNSDDLWYVYTKYYAVDRR